MTRIAWKAGGPVDLSKNAFSPPPLLRFIPESGMESAGSSRREKVQLAWARTRRSAWAALNDHPETGGPFPPD